MATSAAGGQYLLQMLLLPLLDPLGAIADAAIIILLGKLLCLVLLVVGLPLWLWSRHIGKQFDREPRQATPAKEVRGAQVFLWIMVAVMVVSFVALSGWS
jgi:hypothetical protein